MNDAVAMGERDEWRASYRENCECARAIEKAIAAHYHDNHLDDCAGDIISQYGYDRVNWVLANTLQEKSGDGRFSPRNKSWANGFYIPGDDVRWHFCVESHPVLLNGFIDQARQIWDDLGLYDSSHRSDDLEYAGKLLILRPTVLKDEYRHPEYQLFFAQSGFGCKASAGGRKVFGFFLKDGEQAQFVRSDFYGVIRDDCIPEWAQEKLNSLSDPQEIQMGEM